MCKSICVKDKGNKSTVPQNRVNVFLRQTRSREREVDHYAVEQGLNFAVTSDRMSSCVLLNVLRVWLKLSLKQCFDLWGNETLETSKFYGFINKIVFFYSLPANIRGHSEEFSTFLVFLALFPLRGLFPLSSFGEVQHVLGKLSEYLEYFPRCPVYFVSTFGQML